MLDLRTVLIVDDNEDDQRLCRRALRKAFGDNLECLTEKTGENGLRALEERRVDCVLLDYSLPGRNGLEVLKRLRAKHPDMPIIMLTGQGNESVAVDVMKADAQDYIVKADIDEETLFRVVAPAVSHCAMRRRMREQQAASQLFTRGLAHDLKEPVRTALSFLFMLQNEEENLTEEGRAYVTHIFSAIDKMNRLVESVFAYTKLSGDGTLNKCACSANEAIDDVALLLAQKIAEKNALVTRDELPSVWANKAQLTQLFQNLICNALKYAGNEPKIHIGATEKDDAYEFFVTDNGPGVAPEHRKIIFDPFKRVNDDPSQEGTGLGLAICAKIVEGLEGKIWCDAAPDGGAAFRFLLPKIKTENVRSAEPVPSGESGAPHALANVLLVEDRRADADLTRILLMKHDHLEFNLYSASNGKEAVAFLENAANPPVHLILLDLNMPIMDGFEFLEYKNKNARLRAIPAIMCSTSDYAEDVAKAKALGVVGYIQKPAQLHKIRSFVDNAEHLYFVPSGKGYRLLHTA
ncbi:MAG: response regulator [Rickettsiales bacterium]